VLFADSFVRRRVVLMLVVVRAGKEIVCFYRLTDAIGDAIAGIAQVLRRSIASFHDAITKPGAQA
jgi:hypothetical protein